MPALGDGFRIDAHILAFRVVVYPSDALRDGSRVREVTSTR